MYPYAGKHTRKAAPRAALRRLRGRIPDAKGEEFLAERKKLSRYELVRLIVWACVAVFTLASSIIAIVYLANTANFSSRDVNGEIIALVRNIMPWVGASMLFIIGATVYESFSAKWELESAKKLLVLGRGAPIAPSHLAAQRSAFVSKAGSDTAVLVVRIVLLVLGLALLIAGILNGGAQDVLIKAINICTECIGLG